MKLGEKLDELRNNILRDTSGLIAGNNDKLWNDKTLLRYIRDAERRFARQTLIIRDSTTPLYTQVKLRTGIKTYPLHESVIGVLSTRYDTDTFDLQRTGHSVLSQLSPPEFLTFDPNSTYTVAPGRPIAVYSDETLVYAGEHKMSLTVYPAPSATENGNTLYLRVFRAPVDKYSESDLESGGEIPSDYELDVLEWAAYRAQSNNDGDGGATTSADKHKARFKEAVTEALRETRRKVFSPMNVQYGGNGFSYTR